MPDALGPDITHTIRNAITQVKLTAGNVRLGIFDVAGQMSEVWLCQKCDQLIIDVYAANEKESSPDPFDILHDMQLLNHLLGDTDDAEALHDCARVVRTLSGFNNVTVCWLNDGKMDVAAQVGPSLSRPLKWPISNVIHIIQYLSSQTVEVIKLPNGPTPEVASSGLAAPKRTVLESLITAGICACTTVGFGASEKPVGLFALLHSAPHNPNRRTVLVLEHLRHLLTQRFS